MNRLLTILALSFPLTLYCQTGHADFPKAWEGSWTGTLEIFNDTGKVQTLPMELHIFPIDTLPEAWTWEIVYGSDPVAGRRPYKLVTVDRDRGRYLIDENNSIAMEGYYIAGKFYQFFEVMGSRLLTTTELKAGQLIWEIAVSSSEPASKTGDTVTDGEEIPAVLTYPVTGVQRAVLGN